MTSKFFLKKNSNVFKKLFFLFKNILKQILFYLKRKTIREEGNKIFNIINFKNQLRGSQYDTELEPLTQSPQTLLLQWKKIIDNQKFDYIVNKTLENIIFVPFSGFAEIDLSVSSIFGKFFQLKGHKVSVLYCGGALPCCGWNEFGNGMLEDEIMPQMFKINKIDRCKTCYREINELFPYLNIELKNLEKLIDINDLVFAINFVDQNLDKKNLKKKIIYNNIIISEHAYSSTLRKLLRGDLNYDNYSISIYRRFLISSFMYVILLERFLEKEKPTKIICNHGIYLEHGILVDICKIKNIHAIVYGFPYRKNTIMATHYDTYHRDYLNEPKSRWENLNLSDTDLNKLELYLKSKVVGGRDNVNYHPSPIIDKEKLFKELNISIGQKYDCLLTNTLWDAQIFYKSNVFNNMLEWIFETIEYYKVIKNRVLIIRIHPAESKAGFTTNQPVYNEILKKFSDLPKNIIIIKPESNISTYTLVENSNLSIIYGTSAGLEIAYRGIPMIIAGESNVKYKGLGYDVESKVDYFKVLSQGKIDNYNAEEVKDRAKKYAYHLFFRRWTEINELFSCELMQSLEIRINFKNLTELKNNKFLNKFENAIINKTPFEF
jgi:hypothetical protein